MDCTCFGVILGRESGTDDAGRKHSRAVLVWNEQVWETPAQTVQKIPADSEYVLMVGNG
jgi:hypothetical protein